MRKVGNQYTIHCFARQNTFKITYAFLVTSVFHLLLKFNGLMLQYIN